MRLQDIFDQLAYGELSQLSIGGADMGVITPANHARVLAHVNLALTALHKRFPLKEGRVALALVPGRTEYPIHSRFAASTRASREPVRYVLDSALSPFRDDLLKIEQVLTRDGAEFGLNDPSDPYAVATPSAAVLRVPGAVVAQAREVPDALRTDTLTVVYRANHPRLVTDDGELEPDAVEVTLPDTHLEPLLLFIAARVLTPVGVTNEFNAGNNFAAKYELACQEIERQNLRIDPLAQPDRLRRNGWV